jgi:hypothetical protein
VGRSKGLGRLFYYRTLHLQALSLCYKSYYLKSKHWKLIVLSILGFYIYRQLHYEPTFKVIDNEKINISAYHQLQFLKQSIHGGSDIKMQASYPEGYCFMNAIYMLSWTHLLEKLHKKSPIVNEGLTEIDTSITKLLSEKSKHIFTKEQNLHYGAFYMGWSTYCLGKKMLIRQKFGLKNAGSDVTTFKNNCDSIYKAIDASKTPFVDSYEGAAWPADVLMCVASLHLYDQYFSTKKHQPFIEKWLSDVQEKYLDPYTGLIPHMIDAQSGKIINASRGSSQSLMLIMLNELDSTFAKNQYTLYKKHFLDKRLLRSGIREYPHHVKGEGDVDSGPVILDIGGVASIVCIRTAYIFKDTRLAQNLRSSVELFGLPLCINSKKRYLLRKLPILDAFVAFGES